MKQCWVQYKEKKSKKIPLLLLMATNISALQILLLLLISVLEKAEFLHANDRNLLLGPVKNSWLGNRRKSSQILNYDICWQFDLMFILGTLLWGLITITERLTPYFYISAKWTKAYKEYCWSMVKSNGTASYLGLKGRDQWEGIGLWKVAIDQDLVRIVVIDFLLYFNLAAILD